MWSTGGRPGSQWFDPRLDAPANRVMLHNGGRNSLRAPDPNSQGQASGNDVIFAGGRGGAIADNAGGHAGKRLDVSDPGAREPVTSQQQQKKKAGPGAPNLDYAKFLAWLQSNYPATANSPPTTTTTTSTTTTTTAPPPPTTTLPPVCPANQAVKCGPVRKSNRMAALCEIKCDVSTATCDLSLCRCTCVATVGELSLQLAPKTTTTTTTTTTTKAPNLKQTTTKNGGQEEMEAEGDRR